MKILDNRIVRTLLGGVLSLPFPGLGHILARRWVFGASLLAIMTAGGAALAFVTDRLAPTPGATAFAVVLMGLGLVVSGVAALDSMRLLWRREPDQKPRWPRSTWFAALLAMGATGATSILFERDWKSMSTPSASMAPTLAIGDYFFADTRAFTPRRGDLVVFRKPGDLATFYIKRVVGLPGETVQMKDGRLVIDGTTVERAAIERFNWDSFGARPPQAVPTYRETLPGGAAHAIIETEGDAGMLDTTAPFAIPAGAYFMLGDNRDNSADSRLAADKGGVGLVPRANLVGKAGTIFWSKDFGRIFAALR